MKKTYLFLIAVFVLFQTVNATVWRVNNRTDADADFTTLQAAIDGATSGDTLYLEGSAVAYGNGTFNKKLIVFGTGYWLSENDTTQAYKQKSSVGMLVFNDGSQGSVVQGLYMSYASSSTFSVVQINTDSITIERNHIYANNTYSSSGSAYGEAINIVSNTSDIVIRHNWLTAKINSAYSTPKAIGIYVAGIPDNIIVSNNFIRTYNTGSNNTNFYAIYFETNNSNNELMLRSNVMWGAIRTYYTNHYDNILVSGTYNNGTGDESYNNICNGTQYPNSNNNQQNVDMSTVFVDYDSYIDNGYKLAAGSPAIGAAMNGGDCGAFGEDPYILSGMPSIPALFETTIVPFGTSSLPVNIKATSHN